MRSQSLEGGFPDAPVDAACAFRAALEAMARPGRIYDIAGARPPAPLSVAAGTLLLTLVDQETPLFLAGSADCPSVREWLAFHTGAPLVGAETAQFALGTWEALLPLDLYRRGEPAYPDRSATLIVEMPALSETGPILIGPGIEADARLNLPDPAAFQANAAQFPLGLDFFFCAGARLAALPRTTRISEAPGCMSR
ncbi:phosphonate C-P lyase system protein PhnH [Tropicimonas marinistellae]|uniref:phosphonate C-P lyase system protein PhnH n=1 Tax=Tropicimonas marinistellae TaxID=1739787 RepID=UPI00082C9F6F|nr:phosphonate C-P lyase system protein PhnH [Tropicimonas marinistellae]